MIAWDSLLKRSCGSSVHLRLSFLSMACFPTLASLSSLTSSHSSVLCLLLFHKHALCPWVPPKLILVGHRECLLECPPILKTHPDFSRRTQQPPCSHQTMWASFHSVSLHIELVVCFSPALLISKQELDLIPIFCVWALYSGHIPRCSGHIWYMN